jgi:hypothetical protein
MGKKYLETKSNTLESSILNVWKDAAKLDEYKTKLGEKKRVSGGDNRRTENIKEGTKEEYEKFFNAAMKKFKINSPADLKSDEEKKKFFDYVDKNYTGEKSEEAQFEKMKEFKVNSMREALVKVWGEAELAEMKKKSVDEESDSKKEKAKKAIKSGKTMTGEKPAEVEINPKIDV